MADIAIVGVSYKMPQQAEDESGFWDMLKEGVNAMTEWPDSRVNLETFYDATPSSINMLHSRGAHFIKQDPAIFDAPFFAFNSKEAATLDPQHRMALETSYRAFENAGMSMEKVKGSQTAVFAASMSDDYNRMTSKDPTGVVHPVITGTTPSLLANRISWFFDLRGPSLHVDTACSGSMTALHMACQSLHTGDADMALVAGVNLLLSPEGSVMLSNGQYLSPDSLCHSFDHRANGYARGEGIISVTIKPVLHAIRDGDMIRAVIRGTGANQDGRTAIMVQPSADSQEQLIRRVYKKAGLDLESTRYFEAHGTGTAVGDPIEMKAIGRVFRSHRSANEPLYVGSVKSNLGHLEGSAGLAGILKAILVLERGVIPPNALFEKMNPEIDGEFFHTIVPTECIAWPAEGLRRVSVNSFGFGGSNGHAILDDAYHYLQSRGLTGNHCTTASPPIITGPSSNVVHHTNGSKSTQSDTANGVTPEDDTQNLNLTTGIHQNGENCVNGSNKGVTNGIHGQSTKMLHLLVWSAADEKTLQNLVQAYENYCRRAVAHGQPQLLGELAYTLAARRSNMLWRTFSVLVAEKEIPKLLTVKPARASSGARLAFVFTGQGAQYARMGVGLLRYPAFSAMLRQVDDEFRRLGCAWSVFDALCEEDHIDLPDYSQPLCTALQIALIALLKSVGVTPGAVIGHSSGEIAAAYATGALSLASACKVAYYRGKVAAKLKTHCRVRGAMLSANLPADEVLGYLETVQSHSGIKVVENVHVACINSPLNTTLTGDEAAIDIVKKQLDQDGTFAQKLKTGVAYHSPAMQAAASEYTTLLGSLDAGESGAFTTIPMISTVSGNVVASLSLLSMAQYWVDNLLCPVKFLGGLKTLFDTHFKIDGSPISDLLEVGPHSALRRPIQDTMVQINGLASKKIQVTYSHVLSRSKSAHQSTLELVGHLFCRGYPVSVATANQIQGNDSVSHHLPSFRVDTPEYPFDHSKTYRSESRYSRDGRLRQAAPRDSLGERCQDWNPLEPTWRRFLSVETTSWTKDHTVLDNVIYPATGIIIMALEAVKQTCASGRQPAGYFIKEAHFVNPIIVGHSYEDSTEVTIRLRPVQTVFEKESTWSDITITTQSEDRWVECFRARVQLQYETRSTTPVDGGLEKQLWERGLQEDAKQTIEACDKFLDRQAFYRHCRQAGIIYGESFQLLHDIAWNCASSAVARIDVSQATTTSLTHPAVLDCALQSVLAQATNGLLDPLPAVVPNHMFDTWVSATGWQPHQTSSVHVITQRIASVSAQGVEASMYMLADDSTPLCQIRRVVMAPVSGNREAHTSDSRVLHTIQWKPQLSMLSPADLRKFCGGNDHRGANDSEMRSFRQVLDPVLERVLSMTVQGLSTHDRQMVPDRLLKHVRWMDHYVAQMQQKQPDHTITRGLDAQLDQVEQLYPSWAIFPAMARNLRSILLGQTDPLQIAFTSGLAETFYADSFNTVCDSRFHKLLELVAHENPTMRVLEVGAGTGGMTSHVLSALESMEQLGGGVKFSDYTYTDISPSFFETARSRFGKFESRMTFQTLDLDRRAADQGFEEGTYDLIVAGLVLHATQDLKKTFKHLRALLKPGGRVLFLEVVVSDNITTNFAFGLLPGWWSSVEDYRTLSPAVTEDQWDLILRDNGFSGNDIVLQDYPGQPHHTFSLGLSTVVSRVDEVFSEPITNNGHDAIPSGHPGRVIMLVDDASNKIVLGLINLIRELLSQWEISIVSLAQVVGYDLASDDRKVVVVSLLEISTSFLASMSGNNYDKLQYTIKHARHLLWVTCADIDDDYDDRCPNYGMAQGFLRSIRSEHADKHIVSLLVESSPDQTLERLALASAPHIVKVLTKAFQSVPDELEYLVSDGQLMTGRLIEEKALDDKVRALVSPQPQNTPWKDGPPLKLVVDRPGFLDSLEFVEDTVYDTELGPYEVEVESKVWGLNFRDVLLALGRVPGDALGSDCAGYVTRVGSAVNSIDFRPGDRICGWFQGCMRSRPRAPSSCLVKIPEAVNLDDAASIVTPGTTAYYALITVARLREGEKVLIHSAAGATGQMAVQVAQMVGAEIYATVGLDEKRQFLIDHYSIPDTNIFYSRDTSFARGIMRVTQGRGVDVVLNSLSGDALRASWECVGPRGRFIEIGKADIIANSSLPMASFARNVSFSGVDLSYVGQFDEDQTRELLHNIVNLAARGVLSTPGPLHHFSTTDVELAVRQLQNGKSTGRVMISVDDSDIVFKRLRDSITWTMDPNASYVIAGASGGLGRAISRWMARRGARHLILLSRSGATSTAAAQTVAKLREQGVNVVANPCDVSSEASLAAILKTCASTMPPIKGCINSAMVLHDATFDKMTYTQWQATVNSKVQSSWNLHRLLPSSLDFFVLLSSLSGVYGSISQSNYAAGCSFQDALASHRVARGQHAVSLDLGWMRNIGIIAETAAYQQNRSTAADMMPVEDTQLMAVLDLYCDPAHATVNPSQSQLLVGAVTPADCLSRGLPPPSLALRPMFAPFSLLVGHHRAAIATGVLDFATLFRQATSPEDRAQVVIRGLAMKLARSMSLTVEDIEPSRQLSDYGVDSLMAVELRNWFAKDFATNVAVFEIMGNPINSIGLLVAQKSEVSARKN